MKTKYSVEFYTDAANEHRWRITHSNSNIVATSGEGYKNLPDCQRALANLFSAIVEDGDCLPGSDAEINFDWPAHEGYEE